MKYDIWQLPMSHDNCFCGFEYKSKSIRLSDYVHVYTGNIKSGNNILEDIFEKLNIEHPSDYYARSLSVSDIIRLDYDNGAKWYYVDNLGFVEIDEKELKK